MNNRSMPAGTVIPVLVCADVRAAAAWLCRAFGFRERLRIGDHRIQLSFGEGSLVVAQGTPPAAAGCSVMIRVDDIDRHCERAREAGAVILQLPIDHPYGERQYSAEDPFGYRWTFSQSIADVDPASWGGEWLERP